MAAGKAKSAKSKGSDGAPSKPKPAARRRKGAKRRRRYSDAERHRILEMARREGLSGPKAAKRFGISTLTFYNWRKKAGAAQRGRSKNVRAPRSSDDGVTNLIREQVRAQIQRVIPEIVRAEVEAALAGARGRRR